MASFIRNNHFEAQFVATGDVSENSLFQQHGQVYQVCGDGLIQAGELVVGRSDVRSEIDKANAADVFAEDDDVFYDPNTGNATLAAVAADPANNILAGFKAGIASKISGATENTVMVLLNF